MSITAAERARQNERLSQTREEAEEREVKLQKRKNEEIRRAEERHQKELARLNEAYNNQLSSLKEEQSETLNKREKSHQEDVADIRSTYRSQLQRKMEDSNSERRILRDTYENEIEKQKAVNVSQKDNTTRKQQAELARRDEALLNIGKDAKEKMKEAIDNSSRRLRESHDKEMTTMRKQREETLMKNEMEKSQTHEAFGNKIESEKKQREYENATWRQKYNDLYDQAYGEGGEDGELTRSQMLKVENDSLKKRYDNALDKRTKALEESNESFRDSVSERVNNQVKSRDSKIGALQHKLNNQIVNDRRLREVERKNLTSAYEDKLSDLEGQKNEIKETMQTLNAERISGMKKQNDNVLRQASTDYRSQANIDRARYREHIADLSQLQAMELDRVGSKTEERVDKIQRVGEQNNQRMSEYYNTSLDMTRDAFERKITDQRERNIELQGQNQRMMAERFKNLETTYNKRLASAVEQYETKLQEMQDKHEKEIRSLQMTEKIKSQDKEKGHRVERDTIEMKYESKIAMLQEQHEMDKERLQKKHQQDMKDLSIKMNQYNRKA